MRYKIPKGSPVELYYHEGCSGINTYKDVFYADEDVLHNEKGYMVFHMPTNNRNMTHMWVSKGDIQVIDD